VLRGMVTGSMLCLALMGCGPESGYPDSAASPSLVGEPIPASHVTNHIWTQSAAQELGVDREELRAAAGGLPWQLVSAAEVQMAVACTGAGAPTVVYLNGFTGKAANWWSIPAVEQSASNRVCLFDRPGVALSEARPGPGPRTSTPRMHADEMYALMDSLGEEGPFLLVAHSYGGLIARTAATTDPDTVAGMVLVDTSSPLATDLDEPLAWVGEGGVIDTSAVPGEVGDGPAMGNEPIIVLHAGVRNENSPLAYSEAEWEAFQRQAATISSNAVYGVVDGSDHAIPARYPDAVVAATTAVSQSIRDGNAPLGECPAGLAEAGVVCAPL